jgi:hypothetical protein
VTAVNLRGIWTCMKHELCAFGAWLCSSAPPMRRCPGRPICQVRSAPTWVTRRSGWSPAPAAA